MTFFLIAVFLLLLSGLSAPLSRWGSRFWDRLSFGLGAMGSLLGFGAAILCLLHQDTTVFTLPWPSFGGFLSLRIDPLSAVFMAPAFFISGAGLLYGVGYWPHAKYPASSALIRLFYPLLAAGIALVLAADNGIVFLISWELMALSGYFLVIVERKDEQNQQAGFIYLIATHTGTLALFALFALLGENTCLVSLPAAGSLTGIAAAKGAVLFLLALVGFGIKAGIMPLHIWLPGAHASAPSHVSALMSGVMIKTGIYGILRFISFFQPPPAWWGWVVLSLGLFSGILGVVFAIAQHDIKRLLAYHSIENIGIILLGTGTAMLGRTYGITAMVVLGTAGALLHVVNHGLFKGLLFLSAGAMIQATGSKQLSSYGGLLRFMPFTGLFFLGGAVAICGLPPLNGFISEWFVYLAMFQAADQAQGAIFGLLLAIPGLAMIGGLALLCFTKVFGLSFLGSERSVPRTNREASAVMLWAMGLLLAACLWIGIAPTTVQPLLAGAIAQWTNIATGGAMALSALAPAWWISLVALLLLVLVGLPLFFLRKRAVIAAVRPPTWGCGYALPIPRAQYSTSSFAEIIMKLYRQTLLTHFDREEPAGLFPAKSRFRSHTPDVVLDRLLLPVSLVAATVATKIRHTVHGGVLGIYLLYTALTLCLLLALAITLF